MTKFAGVSECSDWHEFHPMLEYRCTDISCYVSKDDEPAIRMLRTEAQELQAALGDTVVWKHPNMTIYVDESLGFSVKGTYTYCTKATIKLDGSMVTPEQAAAEWEAKKATHDVYSISTIETTLENYPRFSLTFDGGSGFWYELRPKAIKQVKWEDVPVGVVVQDNATNVVWLLQGVGDGIDVLLANHPKNLFGMRWTDTSCIKLAPASEQPWMPTIAPHEGLVVEYSKFSECMKITGIAKGYVMEGVV
jgi:hypothetical protein